MTFELRLALTLTLALPLPLRAPFQTNPILNLAGRLAVPVFEFAVAGARVPPVIAKRVTTRGVVVPRRGGRILVFELGDRLGRAAGERAGRTVGRELL